MWIFAIAIALLAYGGTVNAQTCRSAAAQQCKDRIFQVIQQHSQDFTGADVASLCPNLRDNMACLLWQSANCQTREQQQRSGEHILAAKNYLDRFCDLDGDRRNPNNNDRNSKLDRRMNYGWRNSRCYQYDEISRCENSFNQRRTGSESCDSYNRFKDCVKEVLQRRCSRSDEQSFPSFLVERSRELAWTCASVSTSGSSYDRDGNRYGGRYDNVNRYDPNNPNNRYDNENRYNNDRYNSNSNNNYYNNNDRYGNDRYGNDRYNDRSRSGPGYLPSQNADDEVSSHRAPDNLPNYPSTSPRPYNPYDNQNNRYNNNNNNNRDRYNDDRYNNDRYNNDRYNYTRSYNDSYNNNRQNYTNTGYNDSYNNSRYNDPYNNNNRYNDPYNNNNNNNNNRYNDSYTANRQYDTYNPYNRNYDNNRLNGTNDPYNRYNDRFNHTNDPYMNRFTSGSRYNDTYDRYNDRYNNDRYNNNNDNRYNNRYNDTNDPYGRYNSSYNRFDNRYNSTDSRYQSNQYNNGIYPNLRNETYSPDRYGGVRGGYGSPGGIQDGNINNSNNNNFDNFGNNRTSYPLGPHRITTTSTTDSPHRAPLADSYCLYKAQDSIRECDSNHQRRQYNARRYHADERVKESCCAVFDYKNCLRNSLNNHCREYGYNTIDSIIQQKVRDTDQDCRQFDSYRCASGAGATYASLIAVILSVFITVTRLF